MKAFFVKHWGILNPVSTVDFAILLFALSLVLYGVLS